MATTSISQPPEVSNEAVVSHAKESRSVKSPQLPNKPLHRANQPAIRQKRSKNDDGIKQMLVNHFCTKIIDVGINKYMGS